MLEEDKLGWCSTNLPTTDFIYVSTLFSVGTMTHQMPSSSSSSHYIAPWGCWAIVDRECWQWVTLIVGALAILCFFYSLALMTSLCAWNYYLAQPFVTLRVGNVLLSCTIVGNLGSLAIGKNPKNIPYIIHMGLVIHNTLNFLLNYSLDSPLICIIVQHHGGFLRDF